MQYFGGKHRISKKLAEFINNSLEVNQPFVDLFCGSCNVISKINSDRIRIANDKHKYLINMWKGLSAGWIPPSKITKEDYEYIKKNKDDNPCLTGFVGFAMSFGGKWFGGFTGEVSKNGQDYLKCAVNGLNKKLTGLNDVEFVCENYSDVNLPEKSLIYCDIPYKNTTSYCKSEVGDFNHEAFYTWCKERVKEGHTVFVSEYVENVPDDAKVLLKLESGSTNAAWRGSAKRTTEVVYTWNINEH